MTGISGRAATDRNSRIIEGTTSVIGKSTRFSERCSAVQGTLGARRVRKIGGARLRVGGAVGARTRRRGRGSARTPTRTTACWVTSSRCPARVWRRSSGRRCRLPSPRPSRSPHRHRRRCHTAGSRDRRTRTGTRGRWESRSGRPHRCPVHRCRPGPAARVAPPLRGAAGGPQPGRAALFTWVARAVMEPGSPWPVPSMSIQLQCEGHGATGMGGRALDTGISASPATPSTLTRGDPSENSKPSSIPSAMNAAARDCP